MLCQVTFFSNIFYLLSIKIIQLSFTISQDIDGPLYVYYGLENFYQNHRLYVKSQSVSQLLGKPIVDMAALERDCTAAVYTNPAGGPYLSKAVPGSKLLYPCGLIANSLFNDQFTLFSSPPGKTMDETNIAWASDFKKFNNPESSKVVQASSAASCASVGLPSDCQDTTYTPPGGSPQNYKYWYPNMNSYSYLWDRYPNIVSPVEGMQNEHFMVWMRTAALPTFRKLYGTVQGPFKKGTTLTFFTISDFDVRSFGGSKSLIISTLSSIGGRNSYIGTAFIVVGSLALLLTLLFVLKHLTGERRRMGDTNLLRWED